MRLPIVLRRVRRVVAESVLTGLAFLGLKVLRSGGSAQGGLIQTDQHNGPIYDEAGNVAAIEGNARGITGRKLAEEALRQSEERFRAAFGSAALGMALASPEGRW